MHCAESKQAVGPYHDGELDAESADALRQHLAECASCAMLSDQHARLRSTVRDGTTYFTAPHELRARVTQLARTSPWSWLRRRMQLPSWAFAGALAAAVALSVATTLTLIQRESPDALAREVVANHVRSLMVDHLADVATSDQHTVKPWFSGKLDFSPPVDDLARDGFELVGGRLDYLDGKAVAALVYQRRQHRINVFVLPAAGTARGDRTWSINGYNVVGWNQAGMRMWAVSDLNALELDRLHRLLQAKANGG
jgi:mycothiol system anti-sigma-R factor